MYQSLKIPTTEVSYVDRRILPSWSPRGYYNQWLETLMK